MRWTSSTASGKNRATQDPGVDSSEMFRTLRSGRTVFGGGGITPDITVEYDTTEYSKYLSNLIRKGMLNEFAVAYMDRNRDRLSKTYPTIEAFSRNFKVDEKVLSELTQMAEQKGVPFDKEGFDRSARQIGTQIKALLAQKLWGFNEYFVIMNAKTTKCSPKRSKCSRTGTNTETAQVRSFRKNLRTGNDRLRPKSDKEDGKDKRIQWQKAKASFWDSAAV